LRLREIVVKRITVIMFETWTTHTALIQPSCRGIEIRADSATNIILAGLGRDEI